MGCKAVPELESCNLKNCPHDCALGTAAPCLAPGLPAAALRSPQGHVEIQQLVHVGKRSTSQVQSMKMLSTAYSQRWCFVATLALLLTAGAVSFLISLIAGQPSGSAGRHTVDEHVIGTSTTSIRTTCARRHAPLAGRGRRWCCEEHGISCNRRDCMKEAGPTQAWSIEKRDWCCTRHGRGCLASSALMTKGAPDAV